jgi:hypothetical protein
LLLGVSDSLSFGEKSGPASVRVIADTEYSKKGLSKARPPAAAIANGSRPPAIIENFYTTPIPSRLTRALQNVYNKNISAPGFRC